MKQQFKFGMYRTPTIAMLAITVIGAAAMVFVAFRPADAPATVGIATILAVAICAAAAVSYARELPTRGADHITDAVRAARAVGGEPHMHRVEYLPCLFPRKGSEPWVGLLVWKEGSGIVTTRVYGHGEKAYEGIPFASQRTATI
jgi:amino acid transporter